MHLPSTFSFLLSLLPLAVIALPSPLLEDRTASTSTSTHPYQPTISSSDSRLNPTYTDAQLAALKLAPSFPDRLKLLESYGSADTYFKFDFTPAGFKSNAGNGLGGQGYLAFSKNFPILLETGLSMAIGYLAPCGLDSMHTHPRATELVILVNGTSLKTGFIQEDGDYDPIVTTIGLYQGAIRPQGSVHYEFNDNCSPAVFIAGLSSEDPGVQRSAPALFLQADPDLVKADLGYPDSLKNVDVATLAKDIPAAFALGAKACLKRCGIA